MVAKRRRRTAEPANQDAGGESQGRRVRRLKSQAWFWTPEWQAKEREADADIAAGRVEHFSSDDEFLAALERIHQQCLRTRGRPDSGASSSR